VSQVPAYDFTCDHDYYEYYYDTDPEYDNNYDGQPSTTNDDDDEHDSTAPDSTL